MTEQEAKTKWCPFARYRSANGEGINRWVKDAHTQLNPEPARCIASTCMAWRWTSKIASEYREGKLGYCGLTGKP